MCCVLCFDIKRFSSIFPFGFNTLESHIGTWKHLTNFTYAAACQNGLILLTTFMSNQHKKQQNVTCFDKASGFVLMLFSLVLGLSGIGQYQYNCTFRLSTLFRPICHCSFTKFAHMEPTNFISRCVIIVYKQSL